MKETEALLTTSLSVAVPLKIQEIRQSQPSWECMFTRAQACMDVIAHKGDMILFKSKKKGETAEAFNRLVEGMAILSFCPSGIKLFGLEFEEEMDWL